MGRGGLAEGFIAGLHGLGLGHDADEHYDGADEEHGGGEAGRGLKQEGADGVAPGEIQSLTGDGGRGGRARG